VSSSDDDALRWGPDDEFEHDSSAEPPREREPGTVLTAILGGLYVMWGLAWVIGLANQPVQPMLGILDQVMVRFGEFLAYIATPLWFVVVLWLGSSWSVRARAGALLLGLLILLPWPFILPVVM
jgi:hypothetical protein